MACPGDDDRRDRAGEHPTWLFRARPAGFTHEPWRDIRVAARSALQGEAILRRRGYEVDLPSARIAPGNAEDPPRAAPSPLACLRCRYVLDGLRVEASVIECPECGHAQVVIAWTPPDQREINPMQILIVALATLGGAVALLFLLALVLTLL